MIKDLKEKAKTDEADMGHLGNINPEACKISKNFGAQLEDFCQNLEDELDIEPEKEDIEVDHKKIIKKSVLSLEENLKNLIDRSDSP